MRIMFPLRCLKFFKYLKETVNYALKLNPTVQYNARFQMPDWTDFPNSLKSFVKFPLLSLIY